MFSVYFLQLTSTARITRGADQTGERGRLNANQHQRQNVYAAFSRLCRRIWTWSQMRVGIYESVKIEGV